MIIKLVIVDDHTVLRAGLRLLINTQPDMEVVGDASDPEEAIKLLELVQPRIVLLDLAMAGAINIEVITRIREIHPEVKVLVLTMYSEPGYRQAAMSAGASGYVVKNAADTELLTAIRAVAHGRRFVDLGWGIGSQVASARRKRSTGTAPGANELTNLLSNREREVFGLVAQGYTNRHIADQLGLSIKSVEAYRSRLMEKLGLKSRVALVQYALDCGLLHPGKGIP